MNVDPKRSPGPLDLHEVIRYAGERGIGIILYVNRRALERQLDEILPLYRQWGVKGVKYGFVHVGSQTWTRWLHEAVRKAAEHRLMVDIHDEYRPTGYSRTYPNLMTQEGIAGDETSPVNQLTLTILFTRMLAGAADNTICYYDQRVDRNASHAYQLAKAVCLYSPWQFLYWYDRPPAAPQDKGGAGNARTALGDEPELEFFDHMPTVWDDTRVLQGQIGQYAVIARRRGARVVRGRHEQRPGANAGRAAEFPGTRPPVPRAHLLGRSLRAHADARQGRTPARRCRRGVEVRDVSPGRPSRAADAGERPVRYAKILVPAALRLGFPYVRIVICCHIRSETCDHGRRTSRRCPCRAGRRPGDRFGADHGGTARGSSQFSPGVAVRMRVHGGHDLRQSHAVRSARRL